MDKPIIASPQVTQHILNRFKLRADKKLGQNFLIDENVVHQIVAAAELSEADTVLEVGPGIGTLTQGLAESKARVVAVELDTRLLPVLATTLNGYDNVRVVHGDILKVNIMEEVGAPSFKVCANLPYYITTPIIFALLEKRLPMERLVAMVQKEVAERMAAQPGGKEYGALSVAIQYYTEPKIAFIGKFAETPRFQGGGSSHINASEVLSALNAVKEICPVTYAQGYMTEEDCTDIMLQEEAVKAAAEAEVALLFLGLPDSFESEGYDRKHMRIPNCQMELLEAIARVQKNIVVVLHNGSPVEMPWIGHASAVLEAYLGGQASGGAVVDLLFGKANPCGKLAESFPLKLEDTPCYLDFPGVGDHVVYSEGVYVGYR